MREKNKRLDNLQLFYFSSFFQVEVVQIILHRDLISQSGLYWLNPLLAQASPLMSPRASTQVH